MTIQAGLTPLDMMPATIADAAPPPGHSFVGQVISKTVRRRSARVALVWIGTLMLFAVFAPLIANSNPYLIKINGRWGCPLLASLSSIDFCLMFCAVALIVLSRIKSIRMIDKFWIFAVGLLVVAVLASFFVTPQSNIIYSRYREARAAGHVSFVLNAPIPFSASDRSNEMSRMEHLPPSLRHWMGTEEGGGDVFSRLLHACRVAMSIGLVATSISICIGIVIGGLMGYFAGLADILGMRLIELFEAIPTLFLMITLVAFFPGESYRFYMLMLVIGLTSWTGYARFLRAEILRLRNQDFVHAAVAAGLPTSTVVFKHILPNGITPVVISASFSVAAAIVSESTLSFLNLGVIDQPSWGGMLSQSIGQGGEFHWWLAVFPGAAIFLTVFAYNMLGEALADALDPKRA
jgi:peptide/nickel transport system permease protein